MRQVLGIALVTAGLVIITFVGALLFVVIAHAEQPAHMPKEVVDAINAQKSLTVGEVINIGNVLANIDQKPTGQLDPRGNPMYAAADLKFSGPTRLAFARIVTVSRTILKDYQDAVAAMVKQHTKETSVASKDGSESSTKPVRDEAAIAAEQQKMFDAPAGVTLPHISEASLCLEGPPKQPDCQVKNEIPISALSVLIPILDK